jgi:soluble lytic murein transglycosylase
VRKLAAIVGLLLAVALGVAAYVHETSPPWYERLRYPLHYTATIRERAADEKLDPAFLAAVIYQESKFQPSVESPAGAIGLMQVTPATAQGIALRTGGTAFTVADLFAKYGDERLVLAAYNAGQGNVDRWQKAGEEIQFPETRAYVARVEHLQEVYRDAWHSELYG